VNKEFLGDVSLIRGQSGGAKDASMEVNLIFNFPPDFAGVSRAEYIVRAMPKGKWAVIGIGYINVGGSFHLYLLQNLSDAICLSI
jgi:hypothetical protein